MISGDEMMDEDEKYPSSNCDDTYSNTNEEFLSLRPQVPNNPIFFTLILSIEFYNLPHNQRHFPPYWEEAQVSAGAPFLLCWRSPDNFASFQVESRKNRNFIFWQLRKIPNRIRAQTFPENPRASPPYIPLPYLFGPWYCQSADCSLGMQP